MSAHAVQGLWNYHSAAVTHVGLVRRCNEDAVLECARAGLWGVADGMGGGQRGDLASQSIMEKLAALSVEAELYSFRQQVYDSLREVNRALLDIGQCLGATVASTVALIVVREGQAQLVWVGDSRIGLLRAGHLLWLSRDHSLVQEMLERGGLTLEQARRHPKRNIITRAIGADQQLEIDNRSLSIEPGDVLLACTDGLHGVLSDQQIEHCFSAGQSVEQALQQALQLTLAAGAPDNISAVAIRIGQER